MMSGPPGGMGGPPGGPMMDPRGAQMGGMPPSQYNMSMMPNMP